METLLNQIDNKNEFTAFAYHMKGQPTLDLPVSMELDIITLPMREPHFMIISGNEHPEAVAAIRDWAHWVRTMAPPCHLVAGARIIVSDQDGTRNEPSMTRFSPSHRAGSSYTFATPYILISTELTPRRPSQSALRKQDDPTVDEYGRKITPLIGDEEVLRQIGVWSVHMADQLWPDEGEGSWSDRVWQSLRTDQDPSRVRADLHPIEEVLDAFVEFASCYLRNSHFQRLADMEACMFHTQEFARICSGELGAEIMERSDHLWTGKGAKG